MATGIRTIAATTVRFRTTLDAGVSEVSLADADANVLAGAARGGNSAGSRARNTTRARIGRQPSGHVIYESRLELARLLYADFDPSVNRIVAQPFLLTTRSTGKREDTFRTSF